MTPDTPSLPSEWNDPFLALELLGHALDRLADAVPADAWHAPTPAPGWDVATQFAHLHWTDRVSLLALDDADAFGAVVDAALQNPEGFVDDGAAEIAETPRAALLAAWRVARGQLGERLRSADPGEQIPWFGPPMRSRSMARARVMESWAHGTDVADALDTRLDVPAALPHIARIGYATRDFAYLMHGEEPPAEPFRVVLTHSSPGDDRTVAFGPDEAAQTVAGSLEDFCLLVTQRVHRDDTDLTAHGDDAAHWLDIAQAFAGMPGAGREKGTTR